MQCIEYAGDYAWQINSSNCTAKKTESASQGTIRNYYEGRNVAEAGGDSTLIGNTFGGASSGTPPPAVDCNAQNVGWAANGYSCQGFATENSCKGDANTASTSCPTPGNSYTLVEDEYGRGSAYYKCNGTNGEFELTAGSSDCSATVACPAASNFGWNASGNSCTTNIPANTVVANAPATSFNNNNTGYRGVVSVECINDANNGGGNMVYQVQSSSCNKLSCSAGIVNWNSGALNCSGSITSADFNQTQNSTSDTGNTGTANFICKDAGGSSGTWSYVSGSCSVPIAPATPTASPTCSLYF